jgi:uncharacterized protein (DUF1501 family)
MSKETLVIINLRGGADGLNMVVPYRDSDYRRQRPLLAIPEPKSAGRTAIDLDGFFGLHPSLAPLMPLYEGGRLAILHAAGWPGDSHSHFEAWDEIEAGVAGMDLPTTGWLGRYLNLLSPVPRSPMRAVAFGEHFPQLFRGALGVSCLRSLEDFHLASASDNQREIHRSLRALYSGRDSTLGRIGVGTLDAIETLGQLTSETGSRAMAGYPDTEFGKQLWSIEQLIRSGIGLEAASLDLKGWDTHILQGSTDGIMAKLLGELASGLSAFMKNLEDRAKDLLVVVMTEFGRRVMENGSGGTDHGQGGVIFICGGRVRGGRVYGEWPGLGESHLAGPGDLAITTDFRDALGEIVSSQLGDRALGQVFPGHSARKRIGFLR